MAKFTYIRPLIQFLSAGLEIHITLIFIMIYLQKTPYNI